MIIDNTNGALNAALQMSKEKDAELESELSHLLRMLESYYYTDKETETTIETTPMNNEFFVIVRRVTRRGPRLVDTLALRYNPPPKPIQEEETTIGVARPKDPYPSGWLLLSSGSIVKESPHRRENV